MRLILSILLLVGCIETAAAETCQEKFIRLFTDRNGKGPVKIHVTQEVKGGPTTKNYNYQTGTGDWMSEMIEPATMQWTLVRGDVMYSSSDQGKSWKKIREMEAAQQGSANNGLSETAKTVTNAACGNEDLNGAKHDTVEADYAMPQMGTKYHEKFWVNPANGWISKSTLKTEHPSFQSFVTQLMEPAPDLKLPDPK